MVNVDTIKQEKEDDKLTSDKNCSEEDEINPYQNVVLNEVYRENIKTPPMEHW